MTTDHVVERARRGDRAAFDELYERNAGRVYALCFRLTGDPRRAEELTQDAFVRAWRRIGSFRGESLFSTWLHRLAVNVATTRSGRGNVRAIVRKSKLRRFHASSRPRSGFRAVDRGEIGAGGAEVRVSTFSGSIRVARDENGPPDTTR